MARDSHMTHRPPRPTTPASIVIDDDPSTVVGREGVGMGVGMSTSSIRSWMSFVVVGATAMATTGGRKRWRRIIAI